MEMKVSDDRKKKRWLDNERKRDKSNNGKENERKNVLKHDTERNGESKKNQIKKDISI